MLYRSFWSKKHPRVLKKLAKIAQNLIKSKRFEVFWAFILKKHLFKVYWQFSVVKPKTAVKKYKKAQVQAKKKSKTLRSYFILGPESSNFFFLTFEAVASRYWIYETYVRVSQKAISLERFIEHEKHFHK